MNIFETTEKLLSTYEKKFIEATKNYTVVHEYWDVAAEFFAIMRTLYPQSSKPKANKDGGA